MVPNKGRKNGMAYFARQKRQTKTYWAELGFMALGLFGLQPGLFTSLLTPSHAKLSAFSEPYYATYQGRPPLAYSDYSNSSALAIASNLYGPSTGSWVQSQPNSASTFLPAISPLQPTYNLNQLGMYAQQPLYSQAAYNPSFLLPNYSQPYSNLPNLAQSVSSGQNPYQSTQLSYNQPNSQAGYSQQSYGQPTYPQSYSQSNLASQNSYPQPAQPTYLQNQNAWQNSANYIAQTFPGYSAASPGSGQYANNVGSYLPNSAYRSTSYSGSRANPYNTYEPYPAQPSLFGSGTGSTAYNANSYYTGSNYGSSSAQNYPYQTASSGGWQRYLAPSSPLYR
jgi:hypothetical protein